MCDPQYGNTDFLIHSIFVIILIKVVINFQIIVNFLLIFIYLNEKRSKFLNYK